MEYILLPLKLLNLLSEKPPVYRLLILKWINDTSQSEVSLSRDSFLKIVLEDKTYEKISTKIIHEACMLFLDYYPEGAKPIDENDVEKIQEEESYNAKQKELSIKVLEYLNQVCGTNYRFTKQFFTLINSRARDGFTLDDFKVVIDKKHRQWKNTEQAKYLRPITLFSANKFENYLNELETNQNGRGQQSISNITKLANATNKAKANS